MFDDLRGYIMLSNTRKLYRKLVLNNYEFWINKKYSSNISDVKTDNIKRFKYITYFRGAF